jgi:glycosyltransferase involved in cell wall biosynthesis
LANDVKADLEQLIAEYALDETFHLMGFTADIQRVYPTLDVLCFPSHYDAPGRPIFEAAFSAVPSIVAVREPRPDTLIPGKTGLAIAPRDPEALAQAIISLAANRDGARAMGRAAQAMARENFDVKKNSQKMLALYRRCLGR